MTAQSSTYLKYANVQMAAEALYGLKTATPGQKFSGPISVATLKSGNDRASRFTETQAEEFSKDWTVVEHISNTTTGFSGTLLRALLTDEARGIQMGELVMSFRSTEFIDDAVRDNQATNTLEIRQAGWAFGQIADMEAWYASLRADPAKLGSNSFSVTGYSLGGHLATAFNLMRDQDASLAGIPNPIASTYTFNGAGVGKKNNAQTLSNLIADFDRKRKNVSGNEIVFTDPDAQAVYAELRPGFGAAGASFGAEFITSEAARIERMRTRVDPLNAAKGYLPTQRNTQLGRLQLALERIASIQAEAVRVPSLESGGGAQALNIEGPANIEALRLDYQLAMLEASSQTSSYRSDVLSGAYDAVFGRNARGPLANFYDIYGSNFEADNFSAVSNSQLHYGKETAVWIEDQPLYRGLVLQEVGTETFKAGEVKLLVPSFSQNDFGDTHSLALIVDSLSVQNALSQLDSDLNPFTLNQVLRAASNGKARSTSGTQGKSDGDTLEEVVNDLARLVGVDGAILEGSLSGGTWYETEAKDGFTGRNALHKLLSEIDVKVKADGLAGKFAISATHDVVVAKSDFAALISLVSGATFSLRAKEEADKPLIGSKLASAYSDELTRFNADQLARAQGHTNVLNYTDKYLSDRSAMLNWQISADVQNVQPDAAGVIKVNAPGAYGRKTQFIDLVAGQQISAGNQAELTASTKYVIFGNNQANVINGGSDTDRLYGGGGTDTLDGKGGNDYLEGGKEYDTYRFDSAFGKDVLSDSDGLGEILIDTKAMGAFKGAGTRGGYAFDLGGGQSAGLAVVDFRSSVTGYKAVIVKGTDPANTVTINNFDLTQALAGGYLGIKLDATPRVAIEQGAGANFWRDINADSASLQGQKSTVAEGAGTTFTISLSQSAKAGEKLTLAATGLAGKLKAILGDETVDADGAEITLVEGQTLVTFAIAQDGELDADALGSLRVTFQGEGQTASSNSWSLTLKDTGVPDATINGDFLVRTETNDADPITRAGLNGIPVTVVDTDELYFVKDEENNNLVEGTEDPTLEPIYNDVGEVVGFTEIPSDDRQVTNNTLFGTSLNDKIDGKTGNDLIAGNAGNDQIDGGIGNDMIGGGAGNDRIDGGDGDDFISSSADIEADRQQAGPNDTWDRWGQPAGAEVKGSGAMWGVYPDSSDTTTAFWSGMSDTRTDAQSDAIDAGAGDDWVMASWGDDRVEGGAGNDRLEGLAGDDVLEGGDGNDTLDGDGILKVGYINSVAADRHGSDFIDGGLGDDKINGGGGSDNIFGGAGKDTIFADGSGASDSLTFVEVRFQGEDYIDGEDGDDYAEGGGKDDVLYGGSGKDILWGDAPAQNLKGATATDPAAWGKDYLDGEGGDDLLYGGGADDTLYGGLGDDQLLGDDGPALAPSMHGNDYLDGEGGKDALVGGGKDDILYGGAGDDTLQGDASDLAGELHGEDCLDGEDGNDLLIGHGGADELYGGEGDDELQGDGDAVAAQYQGADFLDGGAGDDMLFGNGGDDRLMGRSGADQLSGGDGDDFLAGDEGDDVLAGGSDDDTLQGGEGNDSLYGEDGNDQIEGGEGNDDLNSGDGYDVLNGGAGDDRYGVFGTQGTKVLIDLDGTETLELGWRLTETELGRGSLLLRNTATGQEVHIEGFDADDASSVSPIEQFVFSGEDDSSVVLNATQLIEQLGFAAHGTDGNDQLLGTAFNDIMEGGSGDDVLDGNDGDDRLVGGLGTDLLVGGRGDDEYVVDAQGEDEIVEFEGEGEDTILASVDYTLSVPNIENLVLAGTDSINATGDDLANHLVGNDAANVLDGRAAADSMEGGRGDDTYHVDDVSDSVVEQVGGGKDTVVSSVSYTLPDHVEHVVLAAGAMAATGNDGNNLLRGNDADNLLRGRAGQDRLEGGLGNDVYLVRDDTGIKTIADDGGDADVLELGWNAGAMHFVLGSAFDTLGVYNASTGQLVEIEGFDPLAEDPVSSIEDVILTVHVLGFVYEDAFAIDELFAQQGLSFFGTNSPDTLTGTWRTDSMFGLAGDDTLFGEGGDDWFYGGAGDDWMAGGAGDDIYVVTESGDTIVEIEGEGFDTVRAETDFSIEGSQVESMQMRGDDHHIGIGNDLRNYMYTPLSGSSTLFGEGGNDELIGHLGDDSLHGGDQNDYVFAGEGDDLLAGDEGDDELVAGEGDDMLIGGNGADLLLGESGDDWLDGSAGNDLLFGAEGDDLLEGGEGDDILAGDDGSDVLLGGDGNDELLNSGGADLLEGGNGDDIYREDTVRGLISGFAASGTELYEDADAGTDTVIAFESFTLGENFENLTLRHKPDEAVLVGIGNELNNRIESTGNGAGVELFGLGGDDVLVGGVGTNWLDGGTGADLMIGGTGRTDFFVDDANDRVVALAEGADETVHSNLDYALGAYIEKLVLEEGSATTGTGNELANRIVGNSNDNILDGGAGSDVIQGGGGNDILLGTQGQDGLEGQDGDDLLLGSDEGTFMAGGAGRDELIGGAAADYLDGGTEADVMTGGQGDDTYVVDDVEDIVVEAEGAGTDSIVSYIDHTLQDDFENLSVYGWGLTGIGNASENVIKGHDGGEILLGLEGDDILDTGGGSGAMLDAGAGNDTLISGNGWTTLAGGEGDDVYELSASYDSLVELPGGGYDRVFLDAGPDGSVFLELTDNVEALDASASGGDLQIYAGLDDNVIVSGSGNDEIYGGAGNDTILGGEARSLSIQEEWNGGAAGALQDFLHDGPPAPLTFDQFLLDFADGVSQDSAFLDYGWYAYQAYQLSATPDDVPAPVSLYVASWLTDEPQSSQALIIQPDGTLTWEGGGYLQEELDDWKPRSGRLTWEQLESQYGVRATVDIGESAGYIAVTAYGIPVPGQAADNTDGKWSYGTVYWPRDRLPAETQALLEEQLHLVEGGDALAEAFSHAGVDTISGGDGDDTLDGGDGNDMLFGGNGSDVLFGGIDKDLNLRFEHPMEGPPVILEVGTIRSSNDDVLDGGAGVDQLVGGTGDDTYYVDGEAAPNPDGHVAMFDWCDVDHRFGMDGAPLDIWVTDTVVEAQGEGNDKVIASASVVLANVETVELSEDAPTLDIDAATDAGSQTLLGNSGRNTLSGGAGADFMAAGAGDDTYVVDDAGDVIDETVDAGEDIVRTTLDQYVLGENIEALVLDGGEDLSAAGNGEANILIGNTGANVLDGDAGDDMLAGWRGDDLLRGGAGFDFYFFSRGDGHDTVEDNFGGALHFSGDITFGELSFSTDANDLLISVGATEAAEGVQVTVRDWLNGGSERVSEITFCAEDVMASLDDSVLFNPQADLITVFEDSQGTAGNLLDNDGDPSVRDRLVVDYAEEVEGQFGTLQFHVDGSFAYTLDSASQEVQSLGEGQVVTDILWGYGALDLATDDLVGLADVQVDIVGVNDAPVAQADSVELVEDGEVDATGNVLANDGDVDQGDSLSVSAPGSQTGAFGTLELTSVGDFTYALDNQSLAVQSLGERQEATEQFEYVVVDSHGAESVATIGVTVRGANDAPSAGIDEVFALEDGQAVAGNVLANDSDVDQADVLQLSGAGIFDGSYGTLELAADGGFSYALDNSSEAVQSLGAGQHVFDNFTYTASDEHGASDVSNLSIDIVGANDGPIAHGDETTAVEDGGVVSGNVLANDSDPDSGDTLAVADAGTRSGLYGNLTLSSDGSYAFFLDNDGAAVQSLSAGARVSEAFAYTLADSAGATDSATLTIDIVGVNDGPELVADTVMAAEDGPAVSGNVLANDSDPDAGDTLTVTNPGQVSGEYGALTLASDGSFVYAIDNAQAAVQALRDGQHVSESYSYTVSDSHGATAASQVSIDIVGVNDGPLAHADAASVAEDGVLSATGNVLANDSDPDKGDALTVTNAGSQTGQYGTLALAADGAYTYSLANSSPVVQALSAGEKVSEVFAYTIADTHGATATAQLTVDVTGASDSCGATLTGSDRDDKLVGTECADVIDGAKGSDLMIGGKGDDTYFVDASSEACSGEHDRDDDGDGDGDHRHGDDHDDDFEDRCAPGDSVVELASGGVDTVAASVNYVLPQNLENLMLLGSAPRVASGNSQANVMVASAGATTLSGGAGHDVLVGRSATDTLYGGTGDDKLYGEGGNDKLYGGEGADSVWGGSGNDVLDAGRGDNLIAGGAGDDAITSASGSDVIVAGAGNDRIAAGSGNDFVDAGAGNDLIDTGSGSDFIAAGKGNDTVTSGAGRDVVAFNRGDGQDILVATSGSSRSSSDVLSLGGGIRYVDLTLRKTGQDLILGLGAGDQITSKNWYAGQDSRSISALQIVTVGGDYNGASTNRLLDNQVVAFDFTTITQQYDAARKANSSLGAWALQPALNSAYIGASNTSALGGDLAFDYATQYGATQGYGTDMTVDAVRKEVQEQTGNNWQATDTTPVIPPGSTLVDPWVALQAGTDLVVSKDAGASNPITPTSDPATDSLMFAALAASTETQPSWAVR